jgi:predicted MPP superfamily phosphohydrolase
MRLILATLTVISALILLTYAVWVEPYQLSIVHHDMRRANEANSLRLVQISDLHLQGFGEHEKGIAQQVKALAADVVVLSGDAIDRADALPWLQAFVEALGSAPVLLIPGNWEHWSRVHFKKLHTTGARLLLNERWTLSKGSRQLEITGLDDFTAGKPDMRLLHKQPKKDSISSVLIQHSPAFFNQANVMQRLEASNFNLCLAGHTHGGQVAFWGWGPIRPEGSGSFHSGFYDLPGCRLFVSRGVGTSILPIRLGAPPEVVVFDL